MGRYSHRSRDTVFYVATDTQQQQALVDHLVQNKGEHLDAVLIAPVCDRNGQHAQSSAVRRRHITLAPHDLLLSQHEYIIRGVNDQRDAAVLPTLRKVESKTTDDETTDDVDDDAAGSSDDTNSSSGDSDDSSSSDSDTSSDDDDGGSEKAVRDLPLDDMPMFKYTVFLRWKTYPTTTSTRWAYHLFNPTRAQAALVTAVSIPVKGDVDCNRIIVELLLNSLSAKHGTPILDRSGVMLLLDEMHPANMAPSDLDTEKILKTITTHYTERRNGKAVNKLAQEWISSRTTPISMTGTRYQSERCSFPGVLCREKPEKWCYEFRRLPDRHGRAWVEQYLSPAWIIKPFADCIREERKKTLVIRGGKLSGKTTYARQFGPHIYMNKSINEALLYDCMNDKEARYIVLDDIPWSHIFDKRTPGTFIAGGQASMYWKRGNRTIPLGLPVVIVNEELPPKKMMKKWKRNLVVVDLAKGSKLYEQKNRTPQGEDMNNNEPQKVVPSPIVNMQPLLDATEETERVAVQHKVAPLKMDFGHRVPYGPDSFFYPDAIPPSHRARLTQAVAELDFIQMKYRGRDLARQKAFQSDNIAGSFAFYEYTGSVPDVWYQGEWSPECLEMRDALREATKEPVNSVVANCYRDREACIDPHSDKTPDIQRDTSIWTISLGHTRRFELHKNGDSATLAIAIDLTPGSVFQIGPLTNAAYKHSIPQVKHSVGVRYGLTFRTLASRWLHEEEVALRQPTRLGDPWLIQKKAKQVKDGKVVLREQDGYPSRRVIHLGTFALADPSSVQEQDILRLRQALPSMKPTKPSSREKMDDEDDARDAVPVASSSVIVEKEGTSREQLLRYIKELSPSHFHSLLSVEEEAQLMTVVRSLAEKKRKQCELEEMFPLSNQTSKKTKRA